MNYKYPIAMFIPDSYIIQNIYDIFIKYAPV